MCLHAAHTLGGADPGNSGHTGNWVNDHNSFNTGYYFSLVNPPAGFDNGWEQVTVPATGKKQWTQGCTTNQRVAGGPGCRFLMLNVDMNLFRNLEPYMAGDGSVSIPPIGDRPGSPGKCGVDGRIWSACFPLRNTDARFQVEDLDSFDQNDSFLSQFAVAYDRMISRVTDGKGLTEVQGGPPGTYVRGKVFCRVQLFCRILVSV